MWTQWVNGVLGLWVIIAAWTYMAAGTGRTLLIITGVVIAVLGFLGGLAEPSKRQTNL